MFSYMYELDFPKLDINSNRMGLSPSREKSIGITLNNREQSARERSKLRRSKSTHHMLESQRPKSHRFRRPTARDFEVNYMFPAHEINIIDLEEDESVCNAAAWCVSFEEGQRPGSRVSQYVRS